MRPVNFTNSGPCQVQQQSNEMISEEQRIRNWLVGYFLKNGTLLERAYAEGHAIQILSRQRQRAMGNAITPILIADRATMRAGSLGPSLRRIG